MRIFFWFLFFFVVYRIYKIIRTVAKHNPDEPSIHKTDTYIKQPSYSEHDVIDAEYKEIDKEKDK